ncbi:hypothetical protein BGZ80_002526 [Entomortierella chlamydospora]|uniref:Major facilitator superfamily (MFS) profile domain-containing protein n=1 Tax=Entomortierella chlamydospora TaxID=101097 RepID=A0A9P6MPF1_9FUNG|nr:hypothetical protein BGZ79_000015 [Entomortierella chlamydospora]KAG0009305.1 hypothetical protein BGZ80_002526 [Entomortierella chlamydospora]
MTQPQQNGKVIEITPSNTIINVDNAANTKPSTAGNVEKLRSSLRPIMLYVVSTAQFLDIVNGASVSVAIIPIAEDLKFGVALLPWILNAYTISFAGLLLFSGRMGDLYGHRRIFMFGLFWFASWALVVSFSRSPIMFVISRALQGVGAACTVPTAMALISTSYPPGPERTKAFSVFAAFGGLGAVVGILMAGGLIASIGWPWIFRVSAIAAYVLLILAFFVIPSSPKKSAADRPHVDYLGSIASVSAVTGIVYYIIMGTEYGWANAKTLPVLFAALLCLAAFLYIESKVEHPIMPFRIWKSRLFATSVAIAFVLMAMMQGIIFYVNMIFQEVYGWSAIKTAVGFLVHALLAIVVFTILGRTIPRLPLKPLILAGFVFRCAAALMFAFVTENTSYWRLPFPALIVHVFGLGFSMLPVQITAVRDAANKDQGLVGAIYNTGLQLGAPFGIAILNVISISTNNQGAGSTVQAGPELMKGYKNALFGIVAFGVFGFILTVIILPWDKPVRPPKPVTSETKDPESLGKPVEESKEEVEEEMAFEKEAEMDAIEALALDSELAIIPPSGEQDGDESTIASRAESSK